MKSRRARSTHWQSEIAAERARHCERTMKGKIWSDIWESRGKTLLVVSFFLCVCVCVFFFFLLRRSAACRFPCWAREISDAISMLCFFFAVDGECSFHTHIILPIPSVTSIIIKCSLIISGHLNPLWAPSARPLIAAAPYKGPNTYFSLLPRSPNVSWGTDNHQTLPGNCLVNKLSCFL